MNTSDAASDLECTHLAKRFGKVRAVDDVSFEIPRGSFFSILGPSGCGKTTLMRMIAGFETPDDGDIRIRGRSVLDVPPNRRNVKMVFQHLALFPMMNVGENIAYGLRCNGTPKHEVATKVQAVLDRVALPDVAERGIHQLSGGQKQRIAIARCMVLEPDVLLLDEPLGALDLKLREAMKIELKLLQHQFNTTFVYITHDQSEAMMMSDHVAVMNDGRFEQVGRPQALYHSPATAFVAGFVGDANRWSGSVAAVVGREVQVRTPSGLQLTGTHSAGDKSEALVEGTDAIVFVRPEFVALRRGEPTGDSSLAANELQGTIDSLLFNGANSRVLVRTGDDMLVECDVTLTGGLDDPSEGENVRLGFGAESAMCFAE